MTRNYLPLAQAQNRAIWHDFPSGPLDAYTAALEVSADRNQCRYLEERRERLQKAIRECSEHSADFWNHRLFRGLRRSFCSTDEAVAGCLYEIGYEWRMPARSRDRRRIQDLKEALVVARYFRRFARVIWARRAEAA